MKIKRESKKSISNGKLSKTLTNNISGWLFLLPAAILLIVFGIYPIINGTVLSFFKMSGYEPVCFDGLKNYITVISHTEFLKVLKNTVIYVLWSLVLGYTIPLIMAFMLNEMRCFSRFVRFSLYAPCMIPAIITSMLWYYIYYPDGTGLLNMLITNFGGQPFGWLQDSKWTIPCIVISMTWNSFGGTMLLYLAALQGINRELYEAALIDGAGVFKRITKIAIPELRGIMLLTFCRQIIAVFGTTEQPLAMTGGGPNGASLTLGLQSYRYAFVYGKVGNSLALSVVTFLILLSLTFVYAKMDKKINQ